jgi:hypothetical protein
MPTGGPVEDAGCGSRLKACHMEAQGNPAARRVPPWVEEIKKREWSLV